MGYYNRFTKKSTTNKSAGQLAARTRANYSKASKKSQKNPGKKLGPARASGGGGGGGSSSKNKVVASNSSVNVKTPTKKGSGVSAGYYNPNVGAGKFANNAFPVDKKVPVYNIDETFMNQVASAEATTNLIDKIQKFDELKKVKDIYKNADSMFDAINKNPTLTQFQKNQLRDQISYVKQNHGRLGYSLNDLLAAVGTGAYNQVVGRTPIGKSQAEELGVTDQVQEIFDKYGRAAVLRPDGTVGAISPTGGQFLGDIGRGAANMASAIPAVRFLTGGKGINVNAPDFGFENVAPNLSGYFGAVPNLRGAVDMSKGIGAFRNLSPNSAGYDANLAGASRALQFAPQRDARSGRTPEETTGEGDGSGDGGGGSSSSTFAYQPYALPVSYNYMGGPEQMYLGGGYTQDGEPVGPFYAANGGIANFKDYGY